MLKFFFNKLTFIFFKTRGLRTLIATGNDSENQFPVNRIRCLKLSWKVFQELYLRHLRIKWISFYEQDSKFQNIWLHLIEEILVFDWLIRVCSKQNVQFVPNLLGLFLVLKWSSQAPKGTKNSKLLDSELSKNVFFFKNFDEQSIYNLPWHVLTKDDREVDRSHSIRSHKSSSKETVTFILKVRIKHRELIVKRRKAHEEQ